MKATKHYEGGRIYVYITDGDFRTRLDFNDEQQMRLIGECLKDLARIGGNTVEIKYKEKEK